MNDEISKESIGFVLKGGKLTASALKAMIRKYLEHKRNQKNMQRTDTHPYQGKQTVKQLAEQNSGLSNIEITDKNIKGFERIAKKYGVDFAVKKARGTKPAKYYVFFKGRDLDAIDSAFKEYANKKVKQAGKPSVLKQLTKLKAAIKNQVTDKTKNRNQNRSR